MLKVSKNDQKQPNYFAVETATANVTVAPTIGLLPIPIRPIISTPEK